jgi:hypothetical protein
MLEQLKKILQSLGLRAIAMNSTLADYKPSDYLQSTEEKIGEAHLVFLNRLNDEENNRLTLIESKTSQLISQTGIIFSLLSLFVPLLIDKVSDIPIWTKAILLVLLLLAFFCYILTISNALKNFKITNFRYSSPSAKNVINLQNKPVSEFYQEVIRDLLHGLQENKKLNNAKATNLLHSYSSFKTANALTAILVSCFCIALLFIKQPDSTIGIKNPVKVEHLDSDMKSLINAVTATQKKDSQSDTTDRKPKSKN